MTCLFCRFTLKQFKTDKKTGVMKFTCPHCGNYEISSKCLRDTLGLFYEKNAAGLLLKTDDNVPLSNTKRDHIKEIFSDKLSERDNKDALLVIERNTFTDFCNF